MSDWMVHVDDWTETSITIDGVRFPTLPDTDKHRLDDSAGGGGFTIARVPCENRVVVRLTIDDDGTFAYASLEVDLGEEAEAIDIDRFIDCEFGDDGIVRPLYVGDMDREQWIVKCLEGGTAREIHHPDDILSCMTRWGVARLGR